MKTPILSACAAFALLPLLAAADELASPEITWKSIEFVPLPKDTPDTIVPRLEVLNRGKHMDFRMSYILSPIAGGPSADFILPPRDEILALLHHADSEPVQASFGPVPWGAGGSMAVRYFYDWRFPWGPNTLDEAWIELRFPDQTYWLEMPYGFTRRPGEENLASGKYNDRPSADRLKAKIGPDDLIVPWMHVHYDLGQIQGYQLSVNLANPFDAQAEIVLYQFGNRWDLHSPRTKIAVKQDSLAGHCRSIRLHDDDLRRSDTHRFNRHPIDERYWGTVEIAVDEETCEFDVPSSLFNYVHGFADYPNNKVVPRSE